MKKSVFRFKPFSRKQRQVLNWWCDGSPVKDMDGIIADGAIRSGKTVSMSLSFGLWAMARFNGQNFIMAGKTVGSFRRNVLRGWKQMMTARGYHIRENRSENLVIVRKGDAENYFYIFGGKDEASQDLVQGITAAGAFFDEVGLMPESFVNQATARCSVDGSKFWFNCNPGSPMHWFKVGVIDKRKEKRLLYLHFTMDDNLSLSAAIKTRYRGQYTGVFYRRYIEGLWVSAEGLIYDMFSKERHVPDAVPKTVGDYYVSCDYGIQNATVFLLWQKENGGNRWVCIDEAYYSGREKKAQRTAGELADMLTEMVARNVPSGGADSIERVIVDPSASALKVELKRRGYYLRDANNDVLDGIADVGTALKRDMIGFSARCEHTIREFGMYLWDEKAAQRGEDKPIKENDHCQDAVRYFVKTMKLIKRGDEEPYLSPFETGALF